MSSTSSRIGSLIIFTKFILRRLKGTYHLKTSSSIYWVLCCFSLLSLFLFFIFNHFDLIENIESRFSCGFHSTPCSTCYAILFFFVTYFTVFGCCMNVYCVFAVFSFYFPRFSSYISVNSYNHLSSGYLCNGLTLDNMWNHLFSVFSSLWFQWKINT